MIGTGAAIGFAVVAFAAGCATGLFLRERHGEQQCPGPGSGYSRAAIPAQAWRQLSGPPTIWLSFDGIGPEYELDERGFEALTGAPIEAVRRALW